MIIYRVVTWDESGSDRPVAVWTCGPQRLEMDDKGIWVRKNGVTRDEDLEKDMTEDQFREEYGLFIGHYCTPGHLFLIEGEVSWSCHQAASIQ